jgi:ABC-type nitrate/sulfonate/bicarbonate transport system permease component
MMQPPVALPATFASVNTAPAAAVAAAAAAAPFGSNVVGTGCVGPDAAQQLERSMVIALQDPQQYKKLATVKVSICYR